VRKEIHADYQHHIRLEEDTIVRVGGVSVPSLRAPQRGHIGERQQERRFNRQVLALEGLHGPPRLSGCDGSLREGVGRRDLHPEMEDEEDNEGREGAQGPLEEPVRHILTDRRRSVLPEARRGRQA